MHPIIRCLGFLGCFFSSAALLTPKTGETMAQNSAYCKAYLASNFRAFPGWSEKTKSLRKGKKMEHGKEVEFDRTEIEGDDVLYLHDSYIVTDGIFKDENIVFDALTDEWKSFCHEHLRFSIPDYQKKGPPSAAI